MGGSLRSRIIPVSSFQSCGSRRRLSTERRFAAVAAGAFVAWYSQPRVNSKTLRRTVRPRWPPGAPSSISETVYFL